MEDLLAFLKLCEILARKASVILVCEISMALFKLAIQVYLDSNINFWTRFTLLEKGMTRNS